MEKYIGGWGAGGPVVMKITTVDHMGEGSNNYQAAPNQQEHGLLFDILNLHIILIEYI